MGLFGRSRGKAQKESEQDLVEPWEVRSGLRRALDENCVLSAVLTEDGEPQLAKLMGIELRHKTDVLLVRFYEPQDISPKAEMLVSFESSTWRYAFATAMEEVMEEETYVLEMPNALRDAERRASTRARYRKGEPATVAAVTDFAQGIALSGHIAQISASGLLLVPQKVVDVKSQEQLYISPDQFQPGMSFMTVRIKLPGMERAIECVAVIRRVWGSTPELNVAIEYEKISDTDRLAIEEVLDRRAKRRPVTAPMFADERYQGGGARKSDPNPTPEVPVVDEAGPSQADAGAGNGEEPAAAKAAPPPTILLVGDPLSSCREGRRLFQPLDPVDVCDSAGAKQALKFLSERACSVMVLSLGLPDMPGVEFVKLLRQHPVLKAIPIIAVARAPSPAEIVALRGNGVTDIVLEPVDGAVLVDRIRRHFVAAPSQ